MTLEFAPRENGFEQEIAVDTEEIRPDELFAMFFEKQNEKELDETQQKILGHIWKGLEGAE